MRSNPFFLLLFALSAAALAGASPTEEATPVDRDELVEEIVDLRLRLEELLATLSPEERAEVERRLRKHDQALAGAQETTKPAAPSPQDPEALPPLSEPPPLPVEVELPAAGSPEPEPEPEVADERLAGASGDYRCNTLDLFDSNSDGVLSGADRYWRHFGLWRDDGDGQIEKGEVRSLFESKVKSVSVRLVSYVTNNDGEGGVWVEDSIVFDLRGGRGRHRATLVLNAGALARSDSLRLVDASGEPLGDWQVLARGVAVEFVDSGERHAVLCG